MRMASNIISCVHTTMSLEVVQRSFGDVTVLKFKGWINASAYPYLTRLIKELIAQGKSKFVFDCAEVAYVDSVGNSFSVVAYVAARNSGGSVKISEPSKTMSGVLALTRLSTMFEIYERTEDAIVAFGGDPKRQDGELVLHKCTADSPP
jgi:anti-anti-sigma factor